MWELLHRVVLETVRSTRLPSRPQRLWFWRTSVRFLRFISGFFRRYISSCLASFVLGRSLASVCVPHWSINSDLDIRRLVISVAPGHLRARVERRSVRLEEVGMSSNVVSINSGGDPRTFSAHDRHRSAMVGGGCLVLLLLSAEHLVSRLQLARLDIGFAIGCGLHPPLGFSIVLADSRLVHQLAQRGRAR